MELYNLKPKEGSRKVRNRIGRGTSSGNGKTSGRGQKGQKARSGGGTRLGFEGGQTPLFRRLPKRGFTKLKSNKYVIVNISILNKFQNGTEITNKTLLDAKIIKNDSNPVKILGNGSLHKKITIKVAKFSKEAENKIINAGGSIEVV